MKIDWKVLFSVHLGRCLTSGLQIRIFRRGTHVVIAENDDGPGTDYFRMDIGIRNIPDNFLWELRKVVNLKCEKSSNVETILNYMRGERIELIPGIACSLPLVDILTTLQHGGTEIVIIL